jgi:aspartate-semialdehyde dehydrogenase
MLKIGIVGATGIVGSELVSLLEDTTLLISELHLTASGASIGKEVTTPLGIKRLEALGEDFFKDLDCCFFCVKPEVSKKFVPLALAEGAVCIDISSAFRQEPEIPVIVPEVNGHLLQRKPKLVANPNCSTAQLTVALNPILQTFGLERISVATYQSVSGAGHGAIRQIEEEAKAYALKGLDGLGPQPYLFNVIPLIGDVDHVGNSGEEAKIIRETRKILQQPHLPMTVTAARVPVFRGHSEAVHFETIEECRTEDIRRSLADGTNIRVLDDSSFGRQPQPLHIQKTNQVWVGRIRATPDCGPKAFAMWVAADNLRKGAAHNALMIAEAWWNLP